MKKPIRTLVGSIISAALVFTGISYVGTSNSASAKQKNKHEVELRIMGTSDIHTHLVNYDYYKDSETPEFGLAKTATLIKNAREGANNSLLFDNGDLIQGNPLGDYKARVDVLEEGEVHPVYQAMGLLGYDGGTVGNHEFNYGLGYLDEVLDDSPFPYVAANVYHDDGDNNPENDKNYFKPYEIIKKKVTDTNGKKHNLKVGVIGVVAPQIMIWDKANLEGKVVTKDIVSTVEHFVPEMQKKGADVIVVLSHSGMGDEKRVEMEEDAAYDLTLVDGVDAIISGHNHKTFPGDFAELPGVDTEDGTVNGVPFVMPGSWGSHLGVIDLELKKIKGKWTVLDSHSKLKSISNSETDTEIVEAVKEAHEGTIDYVRQPVGETTADIHSYFALVQDDPSIQIVTNAQKWYVEKQLEGTDDANLPILSAGAPFKAGGRSGASYYTYIPSGTIAIKNVSDLYLYPNTVATVKVTGADVKEWLEMSAGQFNQIDPSKGEGQSLINNDFRTYNYDVIDGVTYEIDVTEPAKYDSDGNVINPEANRIKSLNYNGEAIDSNQQFIVVTNNYRANGTFPGVRNNTEVTVYPDENRQAIIDFIREKGTIDPSADGNWTFASPSEAIKVMFESSPEATKAITEDSTIMYSGEAANGFARYSFTIE